VAVALDDEGSGRGNQEGGNKEIGVRS